MFGILADILCLLQNLALIIVWAAVEFTNLFLLALGSMAEAAVSLLPPFPDAPTLSAPTALRWLAWVIPVKGLILMLGGMAAMWATFMLVRAALKWARLL